MSSFCRYLLSLLLLFSLSCIADDRQLTILHTNDWQSRLLGFGPNADYTPATINDDETHGGIARLAALIELRREALRSHPLLLLDAGDFTMGTLFHTITRESGAELQLMALLGYDAVTLGNHDFDFRPQGLAQMIRSAQQLSAQPLPAIVASNLIFSDSDPRDNGLQSLMDEGLISRKLVLERDGIKIGLLGVMGVDAVQSSITAAPVQFGPQVEIARTLARELKQQDQVDLVIMLSHSGVKKNSQGRWEGEDVTYAREVPEVDLIISGHSHTVLMEPVMVGNTPIVQAGSDGTYLGELQLSLSDQGVRVKSYQLHGIDDRILGDPAVSQLIERFKQQVTEQVLANWGYEFDQALVKTPVTLTRDLQDPVLGNLISDGIRWATETDIAITGHGTLRDDLIRGMHGIQAVSDIFRLQPLGIGEYDDEPGYPLMRAWLTGAEIKAVLEVLLIGYQLRNEAYFPHLSGLRFYYNSYRPPLDRVFRIELGDPLAGYQEIDLNPANPQLYSFGATTYVGSFTWLVPSISYGLLSVVPKHADGRPVSALKDAIININEGPSSVEEYKVWRAMLDYFGQMPDLHGDGIASLSLDKNTLEPRMLEHNSLKPAALFGNGTVILWGSITVVTLLLLSALALVWYLWRRFCRH